MISKYYYVILFENEWIMILDFLLI